MNDSQNNQISYPRGSEWRRWDLQIHTPSSYLNNQFGNDWDRYVKELFIRAISNEIAVIGITDYFCIEGYKKIKNEYLNNDTKLRELFSEEEIKKIKDILLLPNIEFRLNISALKWINFHVIFSDEVSILDIEENFLHELDFIEQGRPQTPDEMRNLTVRNIRLLGERLQKEHVKFQNLPAIKVGMMNTVVDHNQISHILDNKKSIFEGRYYIGIPADEDLSEISWDSGGHLTRKVLIQKSDFIFSSNSNTRDFCLGLKHTSKKEFIEEFHSLKPCVWSSDAHTYDEMFCPDDRRFTWIKANPSFEGFKQIVFEPAERAIIQADKPEPKRSYFVIDKIRFIDNTGKNNFSSEYTPFNQNLNVVIGGKSTGKSLLLYYIAKTIDKDEVLKAISLGNGNIIQSYSFDEENEFDFEIVWKDGGVMRLKNLSDMENEVDRRKIIYIPQRYLNLLSEKKIQSKQTLNLFIQNIILEDEKASQYHKEKNLEISKFEKEISKEINNLFAIQDDIEKLKEEIKIIGDEKGISRYINELNIQIKEIESKTGLSEEEIDKYERLIKKVKSIEEENINLVQDRKSVQELVGELKAQLDVSALLEEHKGYFTSEAIRKQVLDTFAFVKEIPSNVDSAAAKVITFIDEKVKANNKLLAPLKENLVPFLSKVEMQTELEKEQKLLRQEERKLNNVKKKKEDLRVKCKNFDLKKSIILKIYKTIFESYEELQNEFKKYSTRLKDIDLSIVIGFNNKEFNKEVVNQFLNKVDLKKLPDPIASWNEELEYTYSPKNHIQFIISVFEGVIDGRVRTVKGRTKKDALQKLLENRFYVDFRISYKSDSLDKMSPGKKGLVLLKILIELSHSEAPIILDQPEDDMDNRSIYTDLVDFIKTKKKERQIIIATHNPNLVVGADAEEIIVANQSGQDIGRDNERFKFEYVSGALENSFKEEQALGILNKMGIRQHICDVLEGGEEAFQKREKKYDLPKI